MQASRQTVVAAMSGGVDSSVAALLLQEAGHQVIGLTMQVWDQAGDAAGYRGCCSPEDVFDARRVAEQLGIPFYVVNFRELFAEKVVAPFVRDYLSGRTPNPCVLCNREIKFAALLARARELGADFLATGHYARIQDGPCRKMLRGCDPQKDQSYFLFTLTQEQLAAALFPVGEMKKPEVRALARARGLKVKDKAESQDVCFVSQGHYSDFLRDRSGDHNGSGEIVDRAGKILGRHQGIYAYTIGQRKGLGISSPHPLYVVGLDAETNRVIVGPDEALFHRQVLVRDLHWISGQAVPPDREVQVKLRYKSPARPAIVEPAAGDRWRMTFAEPQRAITPGQAAVVYAGEEVLGGGWIEGGEDA